MPRHFEPYLYLADVMPTAALVAWGGFFFRTRGSGRLQLVDDEDLREVGAHRHETMGARSAPYGRAEVEAVDAHGRVASRATCDDRNHAWLRGLEPDTRYRYRVRVDGEPWAAGERCDWDAARGALAPAGRRYEAPFRTPPPPERDAPLRALVLGDFGIGIRGDGPDSRRQRALAAAVHRAVCHHDVHVILTTGDNIYLGREDDIGGTGEEDDDWFFTFYQPYRYVIDHLPVYPAVGNHDTSDTEKSDDRAQLLDNYYLAERFAGDADHRASVDPGLFYRFRWGAGIEFVCLDTSYEDEAADRRYFDLPKHASFLEQSLPPRSAAGEDAPRWRLPFSHHPPFTAGPSHDNTWAMVERLVPRFEEAGVRAMFAGHEHNFQHGHWNGVDYLVTGAAGKLRAEPPEHFERAHTRAWAAEGHVLLLEIGARELRVHPIAGVAEDGTLQHVALHGPDGRPREAPIVVPATDG